MANESEAYRPLCARPEFKLGVQAAIDLQACPFDNGSDAKAAWLLGFKEGLRLLGKAELLLRDGTLAALTELPAPLDFELPLESLTVEERDWRYAEQRISAAEGATKYRATLAQLA